MFRKLLFIGLALLFFSNVLGFTNFDKTVLASQYTIDEYARQQILAATVRITMFAPITNAQGNPEYKTVDGQQVIQYVVGEGLGTLTRNESDIFLVTHDHWTLLTSTLYKVQFHTVANELLLEVSGDTFHQLVRFRDGGTMIVEAPDKLRLGLIAVDLGNGRSPQNGNIMLIAYRQPDSNEISVAAMELETLDAYRGLQVYRLSHMNGESIVGGNSGGGVWANGQLVGNMWTTTMEQGGSWLSGKSADSLAQTSQGLAAQLPASILR